MVAATSGATGGSASEEFLATAPEIRKGRTGECHYVPITDVSRVIAALLG
jgi:prolyl-tRNA synthetase